MKKSSLGSIYVLIFLLSFALYFLALWKEIRYSPRDWFTFVLSLSIMLLSIWGNVIVGLKLADNRKPRLRVSPSKLRF